MGLTLYLEIKRGKIACHKTEARSGTALREGRLVSRASRDEAFWRSQVNFGPPNPATNEKALWSKGKRTPATNGANSRIEPFKGNLWEEQGLQKLFALAPPEFLSTPIFTGAISSGLGKPFTYTIS
ncbi:hypothetical protein SADUNF_Sadunf09G0036400 [Salix dunnii]|uniref:Uncharacterized protein n=1 Tax=Salix dunnii TaxID=1413687 RepID=A0A835JS51_9ROSI|nr:hypothetical protein SADUNF_Sadunf09G0036400 [Salix dunnii]